MDFYDILKQASLNQKKADKELESNKRYSLKFAPMKKIERPKVNREAIAAQLKKKEEEERKKAELEEKKKKTVLAFRAEHDTDRSSKSRKDSSSTDLNSRKKEKASEDKKKLDRRAKREEWFENQKVEERNSCDSEDEGTTYTQKSRESKSEQETKQKPKALSFKELMALAASNRKGENTGEEPQVKEIEKRESTVKLKSKSDVRDRGEKRKVSKMVTKEASKCGVGHRSVEREKSMHEVNTSGSKPSSSGKGNKPTLFPNTKSYRNSTTSSRVSSSSQPKPSTKLDKNSKSLPSDSRRGHSSLHNGEMKRQDGADKKVLTNKHHPPKCKEGRPDQAKESAVVAKQVNKTGQKSQHPSGRKVPVEKTQTLAKQVEKASQNSHHPSKRKGGWLDPVRETSPVSNQVAKPSQNSHHPSKRKGGWLDPVRETPTVSNQVEKPSQSSHHPSKRKGGWLDPVRETSTVANQVEKPSHNSHHASKRKGGWLDPIKEPTVTPGHIDKTSKVNSTLVSESVERKGGVPTGRNAAKFSKGSCLDPAQRTPAKDKDLHSQSRERKSRSVPSSSASAKVESPGQLKERKRGWLDPIPGQEPPLREERGGWLGPAKPRHLGPSPAKRKGGWLGSTVEPSLVAKRGRLLSSEDEEEDSDLDGFIDDTPLEQEGADISSYIKEIFGYDKSKYGYESDYALRNMEASYSQMLKEEKRSERIAREEDAEELRKEKEHEQKKLTAKAKRR